MISLKLAIGSVLGLSLMARAAALMSTCKLWSSVSLLFPADLPAQTTMTLSSHSYLCTPATLFHLPRHPCHHILYLQPPHPNSSPSASRRRHRQKEVLFWPLPFPPFFHISHLVDSTPLSEELHHPGKPSSGLCATYVQSPSRCVSSVSPMSSSPLSLLS